ncbi:MAG: sugar transferase [Bryobacterales bacterium]|nr:sugar transferase [Bryobacterales bacterium]
MSAIETLPQFVPHPRTANLTLGRQRLLFRLMLVAADVLALGAAFKLAYWVRFSAGVTVSPEVVPDPQFYPHLAALLVPLFLITFAVFRLYTPDALLGGVIEYARVFNACTTATMIVIVSTFIHPLFILSRAWLAFGWLLSFLLVGMARFLCRRIAYWLRGRGYLLAPAVIVGSNREAQALAEELQEWRSSGLRVLGCVSGDRDMSGRAPQESLPVLGSLREIREVVQRYGVEDVIVAITALDRYELLRLCEEVNPLKGVHLRLSSGLYEILTTGVTVRTLGSVPLVSLNKARLEPEQALFKSIMEYTVVVLALLVTWPVFLLLAALIRLDSPGPVLHRRRVLGASGGEFDAFKFRTMHVNGDAMLEAAPGLNEELRKNHKLKNDPRVTRVGQWLRRYSLDELPQLFNVLKGQMGLVGPRMITAAEAEKYGQHKMNLLTVKPGLTGLWQVSGRSDISYEERVRLDMYYIRNYSIWLDFQILFVQTLPAVLKGRGAY